MAHMTYIYGDFGDPGLYAKVAAAISGAQAPVSTWKFRPRSLRGRSQRSGPGRVILGGRARAGGGETVRSRPGERQGARAGALSLRQ